MATFSQGLSGYVGPGPTAYGKPGGQGGSGGSNPRTGWSSGSSSTNWGAYGQGQSALAPYWQQAAQYGFDNSMLENKMGWANADYTYGAGVINQNLGLDLRGVGLDEALLGIDRQGNQLTVKSLGFDREHLAKMRALAGRDWDLTGKDYEANKRRITHEGDVQRRGLESDSVQRAANFAAGYKWDQASNTMRTLNDLERAQYGYEKDRVAYERALAGLDRDDQRIDIELQRANLANQQLDIQAQKYGLTKEQLSARAQQGLERLGLDNFMSVQDLALAMESNDAQIRALAQRAWMEILGPGGWGATQGIAQIALGG